MKGTLKDRLEELDRLYPRWEKKTIWEYFLDTAGRFPDREFLAARGRQSYTYRQAREEGIKIARGLLAAGVRPGDHVAVQMENSPEQIFTALAAAAVRAVKIPVNTGLSAVELKFILEQSEADYLITDCELKDNVPYDHLKGVIFLSGSGGKPEAAVTGWEEFLAAGQKEVLEDTSKELHGDEASDIIYTSGSTKAPKGVVLTHDMLMRSAFASCRNRGFELGRRIYVPLPMFHVYGYVEGLLAAILVGGTVLLRRGKFLAGEALDFMEETRANDILSVPAQMMALINELRERPRKLAHLHAVYCSAAMCPAWIWPAIRETLGVSDVITGYGMTEVCGASMQTAPDDSDEILQTRVGKLLPAGCSGLARFGGYQLAYRVVDRKTQQDCPPGEVGELWCKGAVVTKGYFKRDQANRRVFTDDGWFKTGDCGCFDEKGYLIFAGRVDDMYKINGENVSPQFLEEVLSQCDQIHTVAITGVPDQKHGSVGAAFIQLYEDSPVNREKAESYARAHLAKFQVPKYFIYMKQEDWPRTASGKIQKFHLKEMARAAAENAAGNK
ncbi:MAG TPA: acyl--CoA ligase [Candidatus Enterocloster excrementigallinarum]|uniref:Acyl--CoA ligase n=1 Tax=Candidatus Enterocloster excrementigallinarum TaxID=2838558 RepID=A0A9D2PRM7_9FIRM|nr:acyl--CoA ligase [Candidatus Enterocloster excrementigallinarum]